MTSVGITLGILQRVSEFLADLPEEHLAALAEGRARLAYVAEGSTEPAPRKVTSARRSPKPDPGPTAETMALIHELEALKSRDEAAEVLRPVKKPALTAAAKALSVPRAAQLGMVDLRAEIVEATVGRRLDSIAIRGFEGLRP